MPERDPRRVIIAGAGIALLITAGIRLETPYVRGVGAAAVSVERRVLACCGVELAFLGPYLEESGVPTPVPAEVSIAYLGHRASRKAGLLVVAWLGLTGTVVLGALNLFAVSRRWGRRLVAGPLGETLGLTHERLARAERWFGAWGPLAIVISRYLPGPRFPMTVVCGTLGVSYRAFCISSALSASVWVACFLVLGIGFGDLAGSLLAAHPWAGLILPLPAAIALGAYLFRVSARATRARSRTRSDDAGARQARDQEDADRVR